MFLSYWVSDGQQIVCCADTKRDYNKNAGKSIAKFAVVLFRCKKNVPTEGKNPWKYSENFSCSFKGNMIYSQQKVSGKQTHKLSRNKKTD